MPLVLTVLSSIITNTCNIRLNIFSCYNIHASMKGRCNHLGMMDFLDFFGPDSTFIFGARNKPSLCCTLVLGCFALAMVIVNGMRELEKSWVKGKMTIIGQTDSLNDFLSYLLGYVRFLALRWYLESGLKASMDAKKQIISAFRVFWYLVMTFSKVDMRMNLRAGAIKFFNPTHSLSLRSEWEDRIRIIFSIRGSRTNSTLAEMGGRAGMQFLCKRWVAYSEKTWYARKSQPKIWVTH